MNSVAVAFCELALEAASNHPPAARADLLDFAACILRDASADEAASAALKAAQCLREAEAAQLTFKRLLCSDRQTLG